MILYDLTQYCAKNQILSTVLVLFLVSNSAQAFWHESSRNMMGTKVVLKMESRSKAHGEQCSQQAYNEINRIEQLLSNFIPTSEISKINRLATHQPVRISRETLALIKQSLKQSEISNGAFDITYESIGYQYDLRQKTKPSEDDIKQRLSAINYQHIVLKDSSVSFKNKDVKINLGGIAKGYAIEKVSQLIRQCDITEGIISAGGDSKIIGDNKGKEWIIGIQHPRKKNELALRLPLSNIALSTSGDYERYYFDNGQRIHHIINPKTGKPSTKTWSASVIGNNATITDALSTTVFILGEKKGLELINSIPEVDAIVIDSQGNIHYSNGFEAYEQR